MNELVTIPPKNREEWRKIINGEIEHEYRNYVLQMQLTQTKKEIEEAKITMEEAIDKIYNLCLKYSRAVQLDFKQIFKTW